MSVMQMSLTGSCLIAAIAAFRALLFRRLPKRTLVWLWAAAALVLLIPLRPGAVFSIYGLLPEASAHTAAAIAAPAQTAQTGAHLWPVIRCAVSGAMALFLAAVYAVGLRRFNQGRIIRLPWAERWLCDHPTYRCLTIRESDRISSPVSGGILRPVILLPAERDWDETTRECVLLHELTHIRRLDGLVKLLAAAALCLHWFNPLVWLMVFLLGRDLEFACDEAVLSGSTGRADYARALLQAETGRSAKPLFSNGFGAPLVGRMAAVSRFRRPGTALRAVSLLAAAVLVAAFATSPLRPGAAPAVRGGSALNVNADRSSSMEPEVLLDGFVAVKQSEVPGRYVYVTNRGDYRELRVQDGSSMDIIIIPANGKTGQETFALVVEAGTEIQKGTYLLQVEEEAQREGMTVKYDAETTP